MPLGLDEPITGGRESPDEPSPIFAIQWGVGGPELEHVYAVIEGFDLVGCGDRQGIEVDPGEDLRLRTGAAAPVGAKQCVPQGDQRSLVLLGFEFVRPDRLLELLAVCGPLFERMRRRGVVLATTREDCEQEGGRYRCGGGTAGDEPRAPASA